jgi:heme/copper-type cytochrome/quinol oxidase subunit 1
MSFLRRFGVLILGIVFVVVGVVGYVTLFPPPSFGWTAYAPLTGETFTPNPNTFDYFGGLAVAGLVLVAGWSGHRIGRRGR